MWCMVAWGSCLWACHVEGSIWGRKYHLAHEEDKIAEIEEYPLNLFPYSGRTHKENARSQPFQKDHGLRCAQDS